jgi:hypothetical protein
MRLDLKNKKYCYNNNNQNKNKMTVAAKEVKQKKSLKVSSVSAAKVVPAIVAPVIAETVVPEIVAEIVSDNVEDVAVKHTFEVDARNIILTLEQFQKELKAMKLSVKLALSAFQKESRASNKKNKNKTRKQGNGVAHGFAKNSSLSDVLCDLLSLPHGSELSSPKVTSMIADYVRTNELYIPSLNNKSVFRCDEKLLSVLGEPKYPAKKTDPSLGINHSYWNLQTTMKDNGHYTKPVVTV